MTVPHHHRTRHWWLLTRLLNAAAEMCLCFTSVVVRPRWLFRGRADDARINLTFTDVFYVFHDGSYLLVAFCLVYLRQEENKNENDNERLNLKAVLDLSAPRSRSVGRRTRASNFNHVTTFGKFRNFYLLNLFWANDPLNVMGKLLAEGGRKDRVLSELERRKWGGVEMGSFVPATAAHSVIDCFYVLKATSNSTTGKRPRMNANGVSVKVFFFFIAWHQLSPADMHWLWNGVLTKIFT